MNAVGHRVGQIDRISDQRVHIDVFVLVDLSKDDVEFTIWFERVAHCRRHILSELAEQR